MSGLRTAAKAVLGPVYRPPRYLYRWIRAARIARSYQAQYTAARRVYAADGHETVLRVPSLAEVGVRECHPDEPGALLAPPPHYVPLIDRLRRDFDARASLSENCYFMPRPSRTGLPRATTDIPEIQRQDIITLQLRNALDLDGLQDLASALVPQIEQHIYGSYVLVDKVYAYRNLVSRQREQVSWLWHYDNHPTEILKLMIYLTDVDSDSGAFEYVRQSGSGKAYCFRPQPMLGTSRVPPAVVEGLLENGYERYKSVGPAGALVLFDDNVLHKANIAHSRPRDVVVLQFRPALFRPQPYIDPRWTGSFDHDDVPQSPWSHLPQLKKKRLSG